MGYSTYFEGYFSLNRRLLEIEALYLLDFSRTRHCKRAPLLLASVPDVARLAVGLPLGVEGDYFANYRWAQQNEDEAVIDYNRPPTGQPSLWCQWVPTPDGRGIQWDGGEKFRHHLAWLQYLIQHFLEPWGYYLNGKVCWQGESPGDVGEIILRENRLLFPDSRDYLAEAIAPLPVPPQVYAGLNAIETRDPTALWSWIATVRQAETLGFPETSQWIQDHLLEYAQGIERGFVVESLVN